MPTDTTDRRTRRVTVLMLTFNHRQYVEDAIQSVLDQELADDIELSLIVGDDASSDGTGTVVTRIAAERPEITAITRPSNLGMFGNYADLWERADGEYIAVLEGDDYWTNRHKIRDQIEAMSSNPDWSISFHRALVVDESGQPTGYVTPLNETIKHLDAHALVAANFIPTPSVMYRRTVLPALPDWLSSLEMLDWPINLLHAVAGRIGFIDSIDCAYRLHPGGIWSSRVPTDRIAATIQMAQTLLTLDVLPSLRKSLRALEANSEHDLALALAGDGDFRVARRHFRASLRDRLLDPRRAVSRARTAAWLYRPSSLIGQPDSRSTRK